MIYLDAGYGYAFYDRVHGDMIFDFFQLQKRFDDFMSGAVRDQHQFMSDFSTNVSRLDKDLQESKRRDASMTVLHAPRTQFPPIIKATKSLRNDPKAKAALVADNLFYTSRQADAFAAGIPSARVVRLANADHYVFRSNEADVI